MATKTTVTNFRGNQLEKADAKISQLFHEGVAHGFYDFQVSISITKGSKREVVLTGGKGYKFTIPLEDIPRKYLEKDGS